jgi:OOP family OmpA-OmpF porin
VPPGGAQDDRFCRRCCEEPLEEDIDAMPDEPTSPPENGPESEISDQVNDYLESLRARFTELTDRIEEASRSSIDRGRAELDELIAGAGAGVAATDSEPEAEGPATDSHDVSSDDTAAGPSERAAAASAGAAAAGAELEESPIARRLRELEAAERAEAERAGATGVSPVPSVAEAAEESEAAAADAVPEPAPAADAGALAAIAGGRRAEAGSSPPEVVPGPMPRPAVNRSDRRWRWLAALAAVVILIGGAVVITNRFPSDTEAAAPSTTIATVAPTVAETVAPNDQVVREAVSAAVIALAPSGVEATVADGVVVLTGTVPDATTRNALSTVLFAISGVQQIDNRLEIAAPVVLTPEELQAAADQARVDTGFEALAVEVSDGVARVTGVLAVEAVADGVFAAVAPLTDALAAIEGIDEVVTRVQLRGDEAALRADLRNLTDQNPIIFASNSAEIDAETAATLDEAAAVIISYPGLRVLIAGHTDAAGGLEQNEALAAARGQAVLGYLISRGVPVTRLQVVSYGELFPGEGVNQSLNRRIEFEVAP